MDYYLKRLEVDDFVCIGSGSPSAITCFEITRDVEQIIKAVCKTNIYCSEPINIIEINY